MKRFRSFSSSLFSHRRGLAVAAACLALGTLGASRAWAQQTVFTVTAAGTIDTVSPTGAVSVFRTVASGDVLDNLTFDGGGNIFLPDDTANTVD